MQVMTVHVSQLVVSAKQLEWEHADEFPDAKLMYNPTTQIYTITMPEEDMVLFRLKYKLPVDDVTFKAPDLTYALKS